MKRAIIVDDEQAAIDKLERMLLDTGDIEICATFINPAAVLDFILQNKVDIAFLDIEMPKISGIQLADQIMDIQSGIGIIFVTAYSEYAVEAFRCHALDYLLKPVEKQRLEMSISRLSNIPAVSLITPHKVIVNCFGSFSVTIDGQPLKFRTAKAEELFAYLVDNNGRPVHRNHIMDAFWSDYDGDRALILFNTTLHYLKKAFLQYGVKLTIIHHRGSYSLDMAGIECDAVSFFLRAGELKTISAENADEFENTMSLFTGNYFDQCDYDWAYHRRMDILKKYVQMIIMLAEFYSANGHEPKALDVLIKGIKFAPVDKDINLRLLKAFRTRNDDVSIQTYYQLYKDRLAAAFGIEPDSDFLELSKNH